MRNWMKYLIVTLIVAFLTNGAQFYFWNQYVAGERIKYEEEIQLLNATIQDIGTLVDVYSVRATTFPGQEITEDDLMLIEVPESIITESFIGVAELDQLQDKFFKIAITPGTLLTEDMIMADELDDTTRETDLIADTWSVGLKKGDYVDLEITYPYGDKYVVLSHIRVENINTKTIKTYLTSAQRHIYNGVLVDYFLQVSNGATLNLVKYMEPGVQKPATVTYAITDNILSVVTEDPNVLRKINTSLNQSKRTMIKNSLSLVNDEDASAITSGRQTAISNINGAESSHAMKRKENEEERKQALENQQLKSGTVSNQSSGLKVSEGVVD